MKFISLPVPYFNAQQQKKLDIGDIWYKAAFYDLQRKLLVENFMQQSFRTTVWFFAIWDRILAARCLTNVSYDFLQNLW